MSGFLWFLGDARLCFQSSVLRLAIADFFFPFYSVQVMVDGHSTEMMRLVVFRALDPAALPIFGVPCSDGRWIWIEVAMIKTNRSPEWMRKMYSSLRATVLVARAFLWAMVMVV